MSAITLCSCETAPLSPPASASARAAPSAAGLSGPEVRYKFDVGSNYGGVRWRPGPFRSGLIGGTSATVEARIEGITGSNPQWVPSDPQNVVVAAVTDDRLDQVRITVHAPGKYTLNVSAAGRSKELRITAKQVLHDAMQVEITD